MPDELELGPPTIASTTPLVIVPPPPPPALAPAPAPARTYADAAYLAMQWVTSPSSALGVAMRLVVLAVATLVAVLVFD